MEKEEKPDFKWIAEQGFKHFSDAVIKNEGKDIGKVLIFEKFDPSDELAPWTYHLGFVDFDSGKEYCLSSDNNIGYMRIPSNSGIAKRLVDFDFDEDLILGNGYGFEIQGYGADLLYINEITRNRAITESFLEFPWAESNYMDELESSAGEVDCLWTHNASDAFEKHSEYSDAIGPSRMIRHAANIGSPHILYQQLKKLSDPNKTSVIDCNETTDIHSIIKSGNFEFYELALNHYKPNANFVDSKGVSLIHMAIDSKSNEILMHMLDNGVNISLENAEGLRPIDYATKKNNESMASILRSMSAKLSAEDAFKDLGIKLKP